MLPDPISSFKYNLLALKILGFWSADDTGHGKLYTAYKIFVSIFIFSLFILISVVGAAQSYEDLQQFSEAAFLAVTLLAGVGKVVTIEVKKAQLVALMHRISSGIFMKMIMEHQDIYISWKKRIHMYYFLVSGMYVGTVWVWAIFPQFSTEARKLPLKTWFPFDTKESPFYEIAYGYQILGYLYFASLYSSIDTYISGYMMHILMQLDILTYRLLNGSKGDASQDDKFLKDCIIYHNEIISFSTDVESIFTFTLLLHFSSSSVIICLSMYQISGVEQFSLQFTSMVLYPVCFSVQLFTYCWFGNEIIIKSLGLSDAAYFSDWYNKGVKYCRSLRIIMLRSQKPMHIRAGYIFAISAGTFGTILKSSWSYFALLRQVNSK